MRDDDSPPPSPAPPLAYATPPFVPRDTRGVDGAVGVVSLLVGAASVYVCGSVFGGALNGILGGGLSSSRPNDEESHTWHALILSAALLALALLLLVAGVQMLRSRRSGIRLHRAYAILQIIASVALGLTLMSDIYDSPAGMVFYFGAIPGLVGCAYPVILLTVLAVRSEVERRRAGAGPRDVR